MKKQRYFSQKDIVLNNITRIDLPIRSKIDGRLLSKPIICIFYPDGELFSIESIALFKYKMRQGFSLIENNNGIDFYCELRQVL